MKLIRLDIKGFKSFANETSIHFNDEIIGIVGPNGSGKSNIVDAIRWVLGEQKSKELRLEKMVDVIFNGTKSKRRASMAQVSMTFENSKKLIPLEYDTVTISRILYDTNESEYRLNGVLCRLKDIRDLFLDTGIGSNSYAIIELGMVDDILMDKDHARRKMFEQAAGISKYKVRKRETLNKLKNTQNDLDRIEDILFELQSNLKSLEKQARRTKKYYELKDNYKEISIQRTVTQQKKAIEQQKSLKRKLDEAQQKFMSFNASVHELEAIIEQMKANNLDGEKQLSDKQKEFNDIIESLRKTESLIEIKKQNQNFLRQNASRVESNSIEFKATGKNIEAMLDEHFSKLEQFRSLSAKIKSEYLEWKERFEKIDHERMQIQGENNSRLEELKDIETQRFDLEKELVELRSNQKNRQSNLQNAEEELQLYASESGTLNKQIDSLQQEIDQAENELKDLQFKLENIEEEKSRLAEEQTAEKDKLVSANRKLDALSNEYHLLKDMVDNLEGFPESAKFLAKKWNKARPVLSEIIECEERYRSAVEAYLEPYLSYFILDKVEEARESIQLLRNAQKGKSQFFILSSFDAVGTNMVKLSQYGKAAVNVVKTNAKYDKLIHHLLANVVIIDEDVLIDEVLPDDELVYLSSSGVSNRTKHVITGGSVGLFDGKRIGRQKELKKLKAAIAEVEEEIRVIEANIRTYGEKIKALVVEDLITEIQTRSGLINQLEKRKVEFATKASNYQNTTDSLKAKTIAIKNAMDADSLIIAESELLIKDVSTKVESKRGELEEKSEKIEDLSRAYSEINNKYTEAQLNWVKHQNDIENLEKDIQFRTQQLNEMSSKQSMAEDELLDIQNQMQLHKAEIASLEEELFGIAQIREEKKDELNETEQKFFSSRSEIRKKEEDLKNLNRSSQNQQLIINDLKDELTGIEFELRSAVERLKIEFNLDVKNLDAEILEDPEEIEELEARYDKIKRRLENYGEINPMAVEAYDEMLERFENMESQRNDILDARNSLNATISEIDTEATKMYLESFYRVKDHFKEVFRSLFSSEDDCDLILFNLEDPLESDIEIVAKPKGKRPKVLSQLSGGEKTLTATALLFSLYLLKPAPFCIFDEVDAPLDDINIQKFSRLVREFSNESQFIIITHNKSTMAAMDKLYGVYMQEQGVSGITQVDFREYEHNEMFHTVNLQ